jgi:uncharacterized protein
MQWDVRYSMFLGSIWNYAGSLFVAFAYICKIMILVKSGVFRQLQVVLARVGRMAFSSYILMSLLCTTFFYGHGFGYFGKLQRTDQMIVVAAVWVIVVLFANVWMHRYQYGPLEWLWRKLTYGRYMS